MKKSDSQLQHDVLEELKWEPSVHATEIGVEVKDGVVTLSGEVRNFAEKWHAERAAQRVSGVNALATDMKLKAPGVGGIGRPHRRPERHTRRKTIELPIRRCVGARPDAAGSRCRLIWQAMPAP